MFSTELNSSCEYSTKRKSIISSICSRYRMQQPHVVPSQPNGLWDSFTHLETVLESQCPQLRSCWFTFAEWLFSRVLLDFGVNMILMIWWEQTVHTNQLSVKAMECTWLTNRKQCILFSSFREMFIFEKTQHII